MAVLENLQPKNVFYYFETLCGIPHGSHHIKAISDYCMAFAKERGLDVVQDEMKNLIIKKAGTKGYEDSEPVILQGHMDMVCVKVDGSEHDFEKDPLDLYIEDGNIKARNTSLGADNGIAIAMMLALLDSEEIPHPPLETVFTVDEEVGMYGAKALDLSQLKGRRLINLDGEEEGILTVGCAGGIRETIHIPAAREQAEGIAVSLRISGLLGGHSGDEIDKQRGNANRLMARLLNAISERVSFYLIEINGGSQDNVITMENAARILVEDKDVEKVSEIAAREKAVWEQEFSGEEPGLMVEAKKEGEFARQVMDSATTERVTTYLLTVIDGVQGFSRSLKGLVESSLNMGVVATKEDGIFITHLIRSSMESQKQLLRIRVEKLAKLIGAEIISGSEYPAWPYRKDSKLQKVMRDVYREQTGKEPVIFAVHGGLECGLFLGKRPDLDCVSMGPSMHDVHSFNERLEIASTEHTWEYLKGILAALK